MPINVDNLNSQLYNNLYARGLEPIALDSVGDPSDEVEKADVFKVSLPSKEDSKEKKAAWFTVEGNNLVFYVDNKITKLGDFLSFTEFMKKWAARHELKWVVTNKDRLIPDMKKRSNMKKKEQLSEAYHALGKKLSYNDAIPTVKIIIQHTRQLEENEQRFRNVDKIFVENTNGERFLLPTKRPGLARVYARHIAEGGTPYDDKGKHLNILVEEYTKMAGFVRATRSGQFNESALRLVNEGLKHYNNLKLTLTGLTGHRGYNKYFESYTPILNEETDDATTLNELFVQEKLDPRIESVLPILNRLNKNIVEMTELTELDNWAENVINEKLTTPDDTTDKTLAVSGSSMLDEAPGAETLAHNQSTEKSNLDAFDLEEEVKPKVYFVVKKDGNKVVGTWNGETFKPFDRSKYPAGSMDMIPNDCEVDKVSGPIDRSQHDKVKAVTEKTVEEDLDVDQRRAGQLGPTEKVGPKGAVGKLVGANEGIHLESLLKLSGIK